MTYVIDKLEKKEYITRVACAEDRRVTFAQITQKGKSSLSKFSLHIKMKLKRIMSVLSDEEKDTAIELLKRIGLSVKEY